MTDAFPTAALPDLTVDQMREVDRIMIDVLDIGLLQMMENAGRSLADLAISRYAPTSCVVLAGLGGNGGGGLVAARHLHNRGVRVYVVLSAADRMDGLPAHHWTSSSACACRSSIRPRSRISSSTRSSATASAATHADGWPSEPGDRGFVAVRRRRRETGVR